MARSGLATVLVVAMTVFSLLSVVTSPAAADAHEWVVVQLEGTAEFKQGEAEWSPLRRGDTVVPGHEIRTGSASKVLLSRGQETITINPNSTLEFLPMGDNSVTRIFQKIGDALFNVNRRNQKNFEILTPHLVATVKGTEFSIKVDPDGAAVRVVRGRVGVTNRKSGKYATVSEGQFALVGAHSGAIATGGSSVSVSGGLAQYADEIAIFSFLFGLGLILFYAYSRKRARAARSSRVAGPRSNN